jgi:energy-converting hydrogenase Eha subunit H
MNIHKIRDILDAEIICGEELMDMEITMGCGCDLMSHILMHIKDRNTLLLTGLATTQVIYTADVVDIKVIVFVRGKNPDAEVIQLAEQYGIILLLTKLPMFESCGKLYKEGIIGCSETNE